MLTEVEKSYAVLFMVLLRSALSSVVHEYFWATLRTSKDSILHDLIWNIFLYYKFLAHQTSNIVPTHWLYSLLHCKQKTVLPKLS